MRHWTRGSRKVHVCITCEFNVTVILVSASQKTLCIFITKTEWTLFYETNVFCHVCRLSCLIRRTHTASAHMRDGIAAERKKNLSDKITIVCNVIVQWRLRVCTFWRMLLYTWCVDICVMYSYHEPVTGKPKFRKRLRGSRVPCLFCKMSYLNSWRNFSKMLETSQ